MQTNDSSNTSNQVKPDEFRVGDKVWCVLWGEGVVSDIYDSVSRDYTVEVTFNSGDSVLYTPNGKYTVEANRTLFFSEPKIEASVTRPFVPTLVGKDVLAVLKTSQLSFGEVMFEDEHSIQVGRILWEKKDLASVHEIIVNNLLKP